MSLLDVKLVASPDRVRLVINKNIAHEAEIIDYETLFRHIQSEAKGSVNLNLNYEWTPDLKQYDAEHGDLLVITPGEAVVTSTDVTVEPVESEDE